MIKRKFLSKVWKSTVAEDPDTGEYIVSIPDEILKEMGWVEGDELSVDNKDGVITIAKAL